MNNPIAEINLSNLFQNCKYIKSIIGDSKLFPVIKADAYGHGAKNIAQFLNNKEIIDGFCVATEFEADELLECQILKPIFILGKINFTKSRLLSKKNIISTIHSLDDLYEVKKLNENNQKMNLQIKFDTGMGRLGIGLDELDKVIHEIKKSEINIIGCWSHFSSANEDNQEYTNLQLNRFNYVLRKFFQKNIKLKYIHIANSSAILQNSKSYFNVVRPGISVYGISPLEKLNENLLPVMKFKLPLIKKIYKTSGESIGYNRIYQTQNNEILGILQGGYADGVSTIFNNNGFVKIKDKLSPIRGKISMDLTAVDISNSDIEIGQYVTVWGEKELTLENLSKKYGKIPYEFLVNLSNRVEKKYYD